MPYYSRVYSIFGFPVEVEADELPTMIGGKVEIDYVDGGANTAVVFAKVRYRETGQIVFQGTVGNETFAANVPAGEIARKWTEFTLVEQAAYEARSNVVPKSLRIARETVARMLPVILGDPEITPERLSELQVPYMRGDHDQTNLVRVAEQAARAAVEV